MKNPLLSPRCAIPSRLVALLASCGVNGASAASNQPSLLDVVSSDIADEAYAKPISKIDDYATFSSFFPGAGTDPMLSGISSPFFDASILFFAPFACDSGEKQNGVRFEGVHGANGGLVFSISVASTFTVEAFVIVPFLISAGRSAYDSFESISFDAYKRDTGERGTCYYDENGNPR
jgi:hypothetical protein